MQRILNLSTILFFFAFATKAYSQNESDAKEETMLRLTYNIGKYYAFRCHDCKKGGLYESEFTSDNFVITEMIYGKDSMLYATTTLDLIKVYDYKLQHCTDNLYPSANYCLSFRCNNCCTTSVIGNKPIKSDSMLIYLKLSNSLKLQIVKELERLKKLSKDTKEKF